MRNVRPLFALVWETSPPLVVATIILRAIRALLPLASLWVPKLIIDAVIGFVTHRTGNLQHIWKLVGIELGLAVLSDILGRVNTLCDSLLGDRFTDLVSVRLMRHATELDLAAFEDPVFYDKLERARRQTNGRLTLLSSLLNMGQDTLTLVSLSAGLIVFSPWLMVLLVAAVIPAFLGETHFTKLSYSVHFQWTPQRRMLDYLRYLGASAQSAKEVKIFGLGRHLSQRYYEVSEGIYNENKKIAIKRATVGSALECRIHRRILRRLRSGSGKDIGRRNQHRHVHIFDQRLRPLTRIYRTHPVRIQRYIRAGDLPARPLRILRDGTRHPFHSEWRFRRLGPIRQGFEFRNVNFSYAGSDRLVVQNINFRLYPGEKIALIGENGAGKTTLVKLLARLIRSNRRADPFGWPRPSRIQCRGSAS